MSTTPSNQQSAFQHPTIANAITMSILIGNHQTMQLKPDYGLVNILYRIMAFQTYCSRSTTDAVAGGVESLTGQAKRFFKYVWYLTLLCLRTIDFLCRRSFETK